jgi:hypothetical protein
LAATGLNQRENHAVLNDTTGRRPSARTAGMISVRACDAS